MKKMIQWVMAATLVCGTSVFTACSDKEEEPATTVQTDLNLKEKLIGKWINVADNGEPTLTDQKRVLTFLSPTKAQFSFAANSVSLWSSHMDCNVAIQDNQVIVTATADGKDSETKYTVRSIDETTMSTDYVHSYSMSGRILFSGEGTLQLKKIPVDYSQDIIGVWQGSITSSDGSAHDDGETHRWEYKANGDYVYYIKNGDQWVASNSEFNNYFVDGNLLCTRWKNVGEEECREWWEIESIKDGVMKWTGLRQNEEGSTYTATFQMTKVVSEE